MTTTKDAADKVTCPYCNGDGDLAVFTLDRYGDRVWAGTVRDCPFGTDGMVDVDRLDDATASAGERAAA